MQNIVYLGDCFQCLTKLKEKYKKIITISNIKFYQRCYNCSSSLITISSNPLNKR